MMAAFATLAKSCLMMLDVLFPCTEPRRNDVSIKCFTSSLDTLQHWAQLILSANT